MELAEKEYLDFPQLLSMVTPDLAQDASGRT